MTNIANIAGAPLIGGTSKNKREQTTTKSLHQIAPTNVLKCKVPERAKRRERYTRLFVVAVFYLSSTVTMQGAAAFSPPRRRGCVQLRVVSRCARCGHRAHGGIS